MLKKIKILNVIKTLNLGGAEVNLLNLTRAMNHDCFDIHVAYSFGGELESKFKEVGVTLFKYADKDFKVKSLETFRIIYRLAKYIHVHKIQVVQTHNFGAHIWASIAAKLTGCKIVEHVHDFRYFEPQDFIRRRGLNKQYKYVHKFRNISDCVVVLTKQNKEFLVKEKIYPLERIREYQNGIDLKNDMNQNDRTRVVTEFKVRSDALIILTPVRIAPEKNIDLILRIAPKVIQKIPNAVFLIAGNGPLYEEVTQKIRELGLEDHIKMIGYCPDIQGLLKSTDIFLLPSFLELHSIAILEAMCHSVPMIISQDVGCNSEFIINWRNGVLLDPFKDEGWSEAIIKLSENKELRHQIGSHGYETCMKNFNIKDVVRKFEGLYVDLLTI